MRRNGGRGDERYEAHVFGESMLRAAVARLNWAHLRGRLEAKPSEPRKGRSIHPLAASLDRSLHVFEGANLQGCGGSVVQLCERLTKHTVVARAPCKQTGVEVWQIAQ